MTERRGSGRNIKFWHATCQRDGCGHPRVRHLTEPKPQCCAVRYIDEPNWEDARQSIVTRCECTEFQEVKE